MNAAAVLAVWLGCLVVFLTLAAHADTQASDDLGDDLDAGYQPCDDPGCGMCHDDHTPNITNAAEAAAMFEQSVADALWLTEVDELERMWRA